MKTKEEAQKPEQANPDFPEWIKSRAGKDCLDWSTLENETFLFNRLFWAFDAGRDCVWQQYQILKIELSERDRRIAELEKDKTDILKAVAQGHELYAHLKFDGAEFTPYQLALQKISSLEKANAELTEALNAYKEYATFLGTYVSGITPFLHVHNYMPNEAEIQKGIECRKKISDAESALDNKAQ